ncbi:hypothetical protein [Paenibacillus lactis]|uniref:hypothetical protein n=1 Tax=Paenibacillus lactis TaxID=228574 RepID=UPI003D7550CE
MDGKWVTVMIHKGFEIQTFTPATVDMLHYRINNKRFKEQKYNTVSEAVEEIDTRGAMNFER